MAKKINTKVNDRLASANLAIENGNKTIDRTEIIPLDLIVLNKDNIFNECDSTKNIEELANNIKENGLLHNIVVAEVEPNKYLLISGERRFRAIRLLKEKGEYDGGIKATIKQGLSDLEVLKLLFFANSETREYTMEEKVHIIESFVAKVKQYEYGSEKEAAAKFREYVSQAFHISERQAYKHITIATELTLPLKEMLFEDVIDTNTAAALAQLPEGYQERAADILKANLSNKKYAIEKALDYAKRAKSIISKTNTALAKQKTRKMYNSSRLAQAEDELSKIGDETDPDTIARRYKLERDVTKYNAEINQLDKEIEFETQKQDNEVEKIYNNTLSSVDKGNDKDDTGEIEQAKMIERQVHKIEVDVRKLKKMKPSKELNEIQELIDQYKKLI